MDSISMEGGEPEETQFSPEEKFKYKSCIEGAKSIDLSSNEEHTNDET